MTNVDRRFNAELNFMETVPSALSKIAAELERANRLEAIRLRRESSSAVNVAIIDRIMGDTP